MSQSPSQALMSRFSVPLAASWTLDGMEFDLGSCQTTVSGTLAAHGAHELPLSVDDDGILTIT